LQHADHQPAHHIDQHNHDAGYRIAAHKLGSTVHRPVELRFLRNLGTPFACHILADQPGIEIGVNRHLLARHCIQSEARTDFGDTSGALGDDHEIDNNQDDEHHQSHRVVTADQKMAKRFDHLACGSGPGVSLQQHHAGGSHIERQTQQGGDQQHRREHRKIKRPGGIHRHQQNHDRQRDIERKQNIQQHWRQRQHHHRQDHHDQQRPRHTAHTTAQ